MTAQLEMSCDKIINKILYYLSELPIAESFFCLMPNFKELVAYSRFEDYLNKWFAQTQQMKETVILYTAHKSGEVHHDFSDLSYLDKEWF